MLSLQEIEVNAEYLTVSEKISGFLLCTELAQAHD